MWKQCIFLKYCVQLPLVWGLAADLLPVEDDFSLICIQKSAENTKQRRFSASAGTKQCHKLIFVNIKINSLQDNLSVKAFYNVTKFNNFLFVHLTSPFRIL